MKAYDDSRFINPETLHLYANTNEAFLQGRVRGILLEYPGLGGDSCLGGLMAFGDYEYDHAKKLAAKGIVQAYLFPGPWSWGNKAAVRYGDAVARAIAKKYDLGEDFPLAVCGGSMGGLAALMYAATSTLKLSACAAHCPCIDVADRLDVLPEFPRTYISAAFAYDLPVEEALQAFSPAANIERLPDIPYFIANDGADELFPEEQCDAYVEALRSRGLSVEYAPQPGLTHGQYLPEVFQRLYAFLEENLLA